MLSLSCVIFAFRNFLLLQVLLGVIIMYSICNRDLKGHCIEFGVV